MTLRRCLPIAGVLLALLLSPACSRNLPRSTLVTSLRVLTMRADPPEVDVTGEVRLTALVVDPNGGGRPLEVSWRACHPHFEVLDPDLDCGSEVSTPLAVDEKGSATLRVAEHLEALGLPTDLQALAEGSMVLWEDGVVPLTVAVVVRAEGEEDQVAIKRLLLTDRAEPNRNPRLMGVTLNAEPWLEGTVPEVPITGKLTDPPPEEGQDGGVVADDQSCLRIPRAVCLGAVYEPDSFEVHPPAQGDDRPAVSEELVLTWYTTAGELRNRAHHEEVELEELPLTEPRFGKDRTRVEILEVPEPEEAVFWLVVQDGRGGVDWVERRLRWRPAGQGP